MADFKYEIVQHIAVISDKGSGWTREVNLVKWNDGGTKVDIRDWSPNRDSMRKGVTLNKFEFLRLVKALKDIDAALLSEGVKTGDESKGDAPEVKEFIQELPDVVNG